MEIDRRAFLATCGAASLSAKLDAQSAAVLRPEDFGARGDGTANDTPAFGAMSAELSRRGGGTISLGRDKTYIVGEQTRAGPFAWSPAPIIDLRGLTGPIRILGNGARLRCRAGLRFGTFDPRSGAKTRRPLPNYKGDELASPYRAMIVIHDCRAPVEIPDLELDGNLARLLIGGPFGDTGWQVPASGIWLKDNRASETVTNVLSHHHGQDGAIIEGDPQRSARSRFSRFVARYNGRQRVSLTAGRGYDFEDCEFSHTGRSVIESAPAAGFDIEAETEKPIRDLTFARCKFVNNAGCGLLADSGDSAIARFTDCTFVGTTVWSAWPLKPYFRFANCTFVGAVVHPFADKQDPDRATQFRDCRFTDDPALSPTGKVYEGGTKAGEPIVNMAESDNVLFDHCTFDVHGPALLPWGWRAVYRDCTMSQLSPSAAMTKGKYLGTTTITGAVDLYGSMVVGTLIVNGRKMPKGPIGMRPW
jgi:hypothetical protein